MPIDRTIPVGRGTSWYRAETGFFLAIWLYLLWLGQGQFLLDPGIYWNTVLGQRTLERWDVPRAEEFSFTKTGQPWRSHQWLSQCGMALLHALGGLDMLVVAAATGLALLYTWAAHRLLRAGWHWLPAAFVVALAIQASRYHLLARPHLLSIALFGLVLARLADFEVGRIGLRGLLWLPPLFVLWTNCHGAVLGGLATVTSAGPARSPRPSKRAACSRSWRRAGSPR
jgi:hypothetical protein